MNTKELFSKSDYLYQKPLFLANPHGWIPHIPLAFFLVETMKPSAIVELGSYSGNSYFAFCQVVKDLWLPTRCYAVDTWKGDIHVGNYTNDVYERVKEINEKEFSGFSHLIQLRFDDALQNFSDETIELLHIDGTHTYDAVKNDFTRWLPKVKQGGVILLHDTMVRKKEFGVWKFLNEIKKQYVVLEFPFSEGLAVVCKDDHSNPDIIEFIKRAKKDPSIIKLFEILGNNILLEREKTLFRNEVLKMREKTAELNKQLLEKKKEIKRLKR
ncbi:MAG: class I SAM-dependent methyltransferase [Bacteroidales bacterium]